MDYFGMDYFCSVNVAHGFSNGLCFIKDQLCEFW